MKNQPLSSCCHAPVKISKLNKPLSCHCSKCGKPCGIYQGKVDCAVNASAVEEKDWKQEFREYFDKTLKPKKQGMVNLDREILVDFIEKLLLTHASLLSDSTLREVLEEVGEDEKLPTTKCINLENHLFGSCFDCEKIKGRNEERQRCRELLIKRIGK